MNITNNYEWSTHAPLNGALIETFNPKFIVELGTGLYSTPIFLNSSAEKMMFIDNDTEWLEEVKKINHFDDRCKVLHHDLGENIVLGTKLREISQEKKDEIFNYYKALASTIKEENISPKMLFVDHYTCARSLSINAMFSAFDIIVYHDCQPKGIRWYEYYFHQDLYSNYDSYFLISPTSWTGCFIKKTLPCEKNLDDVIVKYIDDYCNKNDLKKEQMYLKK